MLKIRDVASYFYYKAIGNLAQQVVKYQTCIGMSQPSYDETVRDIIQQQKTRPQPRDKRTIKISCQGFDL